MTDYRSFVETQIVPSLGVFAGEYDVEALAREVSRYDPEVGYSLKPRYASAESYRRAVSRFRTVPATIHAKKPYPAQVWRMPPLSTAWLCDDGVTRTLGEMLAGIDEDLLPQDDTDVLTLLSLFGCDWTQCITPNHRRMALKVWASDAE